MYRKGSRINNYTCLICWVISVQSTWNIMNWRVKCAGEETAFAITSSIIESRVRSFLSGEWFANIF